MDPSTLKALIDKIAELEARIEALEANDETCTELHEAAEFRLLALEPTPE